MKKYLLIALLFSLFACDNQATESKSPDPAASVNAPNATAEKSAQETYYEMQIQKQLEEEANMKRLFAPREEPLKTEGNPTIDPFKR